MTLPVGMGCAACAGLDLEGEFVFESNVLLGLSGNRQNGQVASGHNWTHVTLFAQKMTLLEIRKTTATATKQSMDGSDKHGGGYAMIHFFDF